MADVLAQHEALQKDIRLGGSQERGRSNFGPLWSTLTSLTQGYGSPSGPYERIGNALSALLRARETGADELVILHNAFGHLPEAGFLATLASASPEDRLKEFDALVRWMMEERPHSSTNYASRRAELSFIAGYVATVAAGGAASLSLAMKVASTAPEVSGWAYLIGGLGERITWSGGFSGLGRLVVRELIRPFRLDEPPSVDFAADEARVLVDKQLGDPLVFLQLKQSRIATAALFPGVNVQVPFAEPPIEARRQPEKRAAQASPSAKPSPADDALNALANLLMPILVERVMAQLPAGAKERPKAKWSKGGQRKLPLTGE